jgi:5-methylcytosine-specific restriction endonuclease McrA
MVTEFYKAYLKSDKWARKREQAFLFYGKKCFACRTYRGPIQVHHLTYQNLGNENLRELRPLCQKCHAKVDKLHWKLGRRKSGFEVFAIFLRMVRDGSL